MDQAEALAFGLEANLGQEGAEIRLVPRGGDVTSPEEGLLTLRFLVFVFLGAAAVVTVEPDSIVIVTHDGRDASLANQLDRPVGSCAVANQIPQVIDGIRYFRVDRGQDRFRSGAIAMKVAEDGDAGSHVDPNRRSSSDFRETVKRVLTFWHARCTFIAYRKRTGAIPKAEGQQNADGFRVKPGLVGVQLCWGPLEQGDLLALSGDPRHFTAG